MARPGKKLIDWCNENDERGKIVYNGFMKQKVANDTKSIDIHNVSAGSKLKAMFECENGHIFEMRLDSVTSQGSWCNSCAEKERVKSRLNNQYKSGKKISLYEWCQNNGDFGKQVFDGFQRCLEINNNNGIDIKEISSGSAEKVTFMCEKGHTFNVALSSVTSNHTWCKECFDINRGQLLKDKGSITRIKSGNSESFYNWSNKSEDRKEILDAYMRCIDDNNKLGLDINVLTSKSNQKAYFYCGIEGHKKELKTISDVTRREAFCSKCRYVKASKTLINNAVNNGSMSAYDKMLESGDYGKYLLECFERANNTGIDLHKISYGSNLKIRWKCSNPLHSEYLMSPNDVFRGRGCSLCSKKTSLPEQVIYFWCKDNFNEVYNMDRSLGMEADIRIESLKLIIEYNGEYYHQDRREHDELKRKYFEELGYKVIQINEDSSVIRNSFSKGIIRYNYSKDRYCTKLINILVKYLLDMNVSIKYTSLLKSQFNNATLVMKS